MMQLAAMGYLRCWTASADARPSLRVICRSFGFLPTLGYNWLFLCRFAVDRLPSLDLMRLFVIEFSLESLVGIGEALGHRGLCDIDRVWVVGGEVEPWVGFWTMLW